MHAYALVVIVAFGAIERGEVSFRPTPAEAQVPELFQLRLATFSYEMETVRKTPGYTVAAVRFPSPVESPDLVNNTVHAEFFKPVTPSRRPAVVVLHILGADFALSRYLAARLADRGVAALFVELPYYGERRPQGIERRFLSTDIERSVLAMRQGVCDVRRAASWLAARPEVDPNKLGVTGISLGGIVASLSVAVDPTLKRASLMLAGGNLADIIWNLPEAAAFRRGWIAAGRTKVDLEAFADPFDPLTYAHGLPGKRLMMFAGRVDEVIPPASAQALWEAAGRPPIHWYDCGHYSSAGFLLPAFRATVEFFASEISP
jgi:dienelactone hydrolase